MGWFDGNLKQENKFIAMLIGQAAKSVEAIHYLVHTLEQVDLDAIKAVHTLAEEASELRRVLIDELHRTFITPLDREDIFNLSHCFEDMVTYALTTVEEMSILKVTRRLHPRDDEAGKRRSGAAELAILRLAKNPRVALITHAKCASWNAKWSACIALRSRNCSRVPPIRRSCRTVLPARSLSPHIEYVRSRRLGGECVRHAHKTHLKSMGRRDCAPGDVQTPVASAINARQRR